jgi:superfamily II DNA or RNA helicase
MNIYKNIYAFINKKIDYYNDPRKRIALASSRRADEPLADGENDNNYDINQIKNKIQRKIVKHNKEYKEGFDKVIEHILKTNYIERYLDKTEYIYRTNQIEAINRLNKNGFETGIHNQATGCGKSTIILKYIDKAINENKSVILFTERLSIFSDLFKFNKDKLEQLDVLMDWKEKHICNLLDTKIINRITIKKKNWVEEFSKDKPQLLVINRAYLTLNKEYKKISQNNFIILHDECHNTTSDQCFEFLLYFKNMNIPIIGFSATPLRSCKKEEISRLLDIYGIDGELNLLTNYNMLHAIQEKLILPPNFSWFELKNKKTNIITNDDSEDIKKVLNVYEEAIIDMPYKKTIIWCGTTELTNRWYDIFKKYFLNSNKDFKLFKDHTSYDNNFDKIEANQNYEEFKDREENGIIFCCNKHREGSDIKNLDSCIFLDYVKNRSSLIFIQSIGRVLRKNINKQCGFIIDPYVCDNSSNHGAELVNKIIQYYLDLQNISTIPYSIEDKIKAFQNIKKSIKLNEKSIQICDQGIVINCKYLDNVVWNDINENFIPIMQKKLNITKDELFNSIINKCKELEQFQNPNNDFWTEYSKLDHDKLEIPKDIYESYKEKFNENTWYDLLGFNNMFISLDEFRKQFYKKCPQITSLNEAIYNKIKINLKVPNYPFEYYRLHKISQYNDLL